ncbi:MAG: glucan biosynthesis protein [Pseudomonadota bacterium]
MNRRRALLSGGATVLFCATRPVGSQTQPRSLLDEARTLARAPYQPPSGALPPPFDDLTYDSYRAIRPVAGRGAMLSQGEDFHIDLLPPGLYFPDPFLIERSVGGAFRTVPLTLDLFSFDPRYFDSVADTGQETGFSGLRLRHPVNSPDIMDEFAVIQGASYFRAIGQAMVYGLSARAVALGTGGPDPEEFPRFTRIRLHDGVAGQIRVEAVIDSPSLAGYMDMALTPGADTVTDISVALLPRVGLDAIGIAPLTSMYLKGPMHSAASDDFRPRVHDSDVLFIENGAGEMLWRPIDNPTHVETSALADNAPVSFGLYQTARKYEDFEDTEARYEDRPSAVVRPKGAWGPGAVILVEIPTGTEFLDNIVAFWRPEVPLAAGAEYQFEYELRWTLDAPAPLAPARILQSRSGREHLTPGVRRFVVDFDTHAEDLVPDLSVSGSDQEVLSGLSVFQLPEGRGTRATFLLTPGNAEVCEIRFALRSANGIPQSPIWMHRWTRKRDGGV